jgi:hypothetical protein
MKASCNSNRGKAPAQVDYNIFLIILFREIPRLESSDLALFGIFIGRILEFSQSFVFLSTVFLEFFVAFAADTLLIREL